MKTVILCGGKGTRIRGVADNLPKPMIPIGNHPILFHLMNHYASYNFKEFVLCLGYLSWEIKNYFLNFKKRSSSFTLNMDTNTATDFDVDSQALDWKIVMAETGLESYTGARVRKIRKYVEDDKYFMLTYGDGLSNVNIDDLISFHKKHGKIATLTGVKPPGRFGELSITDEYHVNEFSEKPETSTSSINGGFFVLDAKKIWDYLPDDEFLSFEQEPLKKLASENELMMYSHEGFWQPMDTYREYTLLNNLWKENLKSEKYWKMDYKIRE